MRAAAAALACGAVLLCGAGAASSRAAQPPRTLRVCADPNNLPFSNDRRQGFENRLADIVADDIGAQVVYTWWAQRRGFVRNTIDAHTCDVLMGVPTGFERTLNTRPYYRSSYAFVWQRNRHLNIASLDDPQLRRLRVGVQLVGDDGQNTPPAHALARRGITGNLAGYTVYGNYVEPNPPARIVDAVVKGDVDVAVVWGPVAGYFGAAASRPLVVRPVSPQRDRTGMPLAFDISVGVNRALPRLRDDVDAALVRRRAEVVRLLDAYHVPRVANAAAAREGHAR